MSDLIASLPVWDDNEAWGDFWARLTPREQSLHSRIGYHFTDDEQLSTHVDNYPYHVAMKNGTSAVDHERWLAETFDLESVRDYDYGIDDYWFKDRQVSIMFKLAWGGSKQV